MMNSQRRPRRLLAACHRCHSHKIKCSGEKPCGSCVANNSANECLFPHKERKVPVSESYLRKLEADSKRLQDVVGAQNLQTPESLHNTPGPSRRGDEDDNLGLSPEESNMLNPLFDGRPANLSHGRFSSGHEAGFIGEASCAAFSNRLLQCLDDTYTPSTAGFSNFHRLNTHRLSMMDPADDFPERMHAKLLLNVARRFIGNYHPLFLEVTFMRELDAVYRSELTPSTLWLCKFFALMALGEIYTNRRGTGDSGIVPGTRYYERSVHMLQDYDLYEEPCLMHVEVLTLLAWASNIFGRIRTAYCYSGTAVRLAMSMGMHRAASSSTTLTPVERESRRRTWWVLYFFDRFSASKLGQPTTVRDEDIDVEMPSIDGLTEEERAEFLDPQPLVTNTKLARIIGNILTDIYGIPNRTNGLCIHRVHGILKQLREWHGELPSELRVKDFGTPRPVASLHLAYNQCIIQTTRPVLLHLFKTHFQLGNAAKATTPAQGKKKQPQLRRRQGFSSITLALAESCVNAAQASSRIVEGLFLDGSIASYGYWDAHHIFSAALILIMSSVMKPATATSEALETLLSILRSMKNDGSIPAVDFCERLSHIRVRVSNLKSRGHIAEQPVFDCEALGQKEPQQEQLPCEQQGHASSGPVASVGTSFQAPGNPHGSGASMNYGSIDILGNPLLGSFLDEGRMPWPDVLCSDDGTLKQFASEIEEQFMFQM